MDLILNLVFFSHFSPFMNPQAQDLISRMLAKDPKERISVLEMKVCRHYICMYIMIVLYELL